MDEITREDQYICELLEEHEKWLSAFDDAHLKAWNRLVKGEIEAAACEAGMRRLLESNGISVSPNNNVRSDGSGPDFRCESKGSVFYVEVTCILRSTAVTKTQIPIDGGGRLLGFDGFGMTESVFNECGGKAKQCREMDAPTLVAVGTFHYFAALSCFSKTIVASVLTGKTKLAWDVDLNTGKSGDSYQITELDKAAFLRRDSSSILGFARNSISGLILHGIGLSQCIGVLHPNPVRPFDPELLPRIDFGSVSLDAGSNKLVVRWGNKAGRG